MENDSSVEPTPKSESADNFLFIDCSPTEKTSNVALGSIPTFETENFNVPLSDYMQITSTDSVNKLAYPAALFQYAGLGKSPGSHSYFCLIGECKIKGKRLAVTAETRGNIRKHVKRCHSTELELFNHLIAELDRNKHVYLKKSRQEAESCRSPVELKQENLSFTDYRGIISQEMFDNFIVEYICEAVLPVYHVDRPEFRKLMERLCPNFHLRGRKFYRKEISNAFARRKSMLKAKLNATHWICSTADCWSSRRKTFIGVNVHWIDDQLRRQSACLAVRRITGKSSYDVLANLLEEIYAEYEIAAKLTETITDNGSNFAKAFHCFGTKPEAIDTANDPCDNLFICVNSGSEGIASDFKESGESSDESPELFSTDQENVEFIPITDIMNDNSTPERIYCLPPHRRCACLTLSLIARHDMYQEVDLGLGRLIQSTEAKLDKLWSKRNSSCKASDVIRENLKALFIVSNGNGLNSHYDALVKVKHFLCTKRSELKLIFEKFKITYFRPVEEEFIKEYVKVTRPLADAIDVLQGDLDISIGFLLPTLTILLRKMEVLRNKPGIIHCQGIVSCIIDAVKRRFASCFNDKELHVAAILVPKFKLLWIPESDRQEIKSYIVSIYDTFKINDVEENSDRYVYFFHKNRIS